MRRGDDYEYLIHPWLWLAIALVEAVSMVAPHPRLPRWAFALLSVVSFAMFLRGRRQRRSAS